MVDEYDADDGGDESVALAFGPDIEGWPTAQDALDAFLENQVVAAGGPRAPDGAPAGQPDVEEESDDEVTWTLTSGGSPQGWVSAVRRPTGWIIQAYSRRRR